MDSRRLGSNLLRKPAITWATRVKNVSPPVPPPPPPPRAKASVWIAVMPMAMTARTIAILRSIKLSFYGRTCILGCFPTRRASPRALVGLPMNVGTGHLRVCARLPRLFECCGNQLWAHGGCNQGPGAATPGAELRPPCASTMEREIDAPYPCHPAPSFRTRGAEDGYRSDGCRCHPITWLSRKAAGERPAASG